MRWVLWCVCLILTACGNGGSSSSTPGNSTPISPVVTTLSQPSLTLTEH